MALVTERIGVTINGEEGPSVSGESFTSSDPSTGEELATVALGGPEDVDRAVRAAEDAFYGFWRDWAPKDRATVLFGIAAALREGGDPLAVIAARDGGLPLTGASNDVVVAARYFEYYAGLADKIGGETIPLGPDFLDYTVREPWGVCGVIVPYNSPYQLMARSVAAALAAGNTVVVKSGEQAPIGPSLLARVAHEAGLPAGVLHVVPGFGPAGAALTSHPKVRHITFTGSLPTARHVLRAAAEEMTPACVELGGKSPQIVFADADLEAAADTILRSLVYYAGQTCSAGTRLLVERSVHHDLAEAVRQRAIDARIGPAIEDPDLGPLVSERQRDTVLAAIRDAAGSGRVLAGGDVPDGFDTGFFVQPTVIDDVDPRSPVAQEEIFGPVLCITPFDDDADAVRIANDSQFGLAAGVWTRDLSRAHQLARDIETGQVFVNTYGVGGAVEIPFGGYKKSGIGREKGIAGFLEYTQIKNVCVALGQ